MSEVVEPVAITKVEGENLIKMLPEGADVVCVVYIQENKPTVLIVDKLTHRQYELVSKLVADATETMVSHHQPGAGN